MITQPFIGWYHLDDFPTFHDGLPPSNSSFCSWTTCSITRLSIIWSCYADYYGDKDNKKFIPTLLKCKNWTYITLLKCKNKVYATLLKCNPCLLPTPHPAALSCGSILWSRVSLSFIDWLLFLHFHVFPLSHCSFLYRKVDTDLENVSAVLPPWQCISLVVNLR